MLTRRQFLTRSSILAAAHPLMSNASSHTKQLENLDSSILTCVNKLTQDKKITLSILYPKGCLANLQPLTDRFTQATGITFDLKETGVDDINSTIIFKSAQDQHVFDIALPATFGIPDLVSAGALEPLDTYTKKYEPADYKNYQLYDYGDYVNGQFYGYQTDGDTYVMFYNKAMLDDSDKQKQFEGQYGYPLALPKTWQQLDDMIRFFHQPAKQQYGGCLFRTPGYGAWEWWSRFHAKGYYPMDNQGNPQINNAAGISALEDMIKVSQYLHPKTDSDGLFENWATFGENQTFCNIGWGGSQKYFNSDKSKVKDNLYYGPTPGGRIKEKTISCPIFNWGWNYVVSSLCPEKEIAYLFTLYACSPVMSTLSVQQDGYFDPFREEHYTNKEIQETYSPDFLSAHKFSMKNSIPDFYIQNQSAYLSVLQENIHLAYKGSLSAKQALDITATEWKIQTAKIGKDKQKQNWLTLKEKYPTALKSVLS
ncbi:MAG: extracellular solute-binding protein [Cellvibrionaceae bacterium]